MALNDFDRRTFLKVGSLSLFGNGLIGLAGAIRRKLKM